MRRKRRINEIENDELENLPAIFSFDIESSEAEMPSLWYRKGINQ